MSKPDAFREFQKCQCDLRLFVLKGGPCSVHAIIIEIATLRCIVNRVVWQLCIQMTSQKLYMLMFAFICSFGGLQITSDVCLQRISF